MHDPKLIADFKAAGLTLPKTMKYDAQVIWVLDESNPEMVANGEGLHAKRAAAGECPKSQVVKGRDPQLRDLGLAAGAKIRLYVVGHGTAVCRRNPDQTVEMIKFGIEAGEKQVLDDSEFAPVLQQLIAKMPGRKVQRISLVMCDSAGFEDHENPDESFENRLDQSFAHKLAQRCGDLTTDVTGRRGIVVPQLKRSGPIEAIDAMFGKYGQQTTFVRHEEKYVYGAAKHVRGVHHSGTYVFEKGKTPRLKEGYRE